MIVMKVGSLVECINAKNIDHWRIPLVAGAIYTVREIATDEVEGQIITGLLLEEIVNVPHPYSGLELGYTINRFREIQPPMSLEFIQELQFEMV